MIIEATSDVLEKLSDTEKRVAAAGANVAESNALGDLNKVSEYMKHITVRKAGTVK